MAEHNENVPEQTLPLLTMDDITPADYNVKIGNNNPRVDFDKLRILENSCRIVKDILLAHPCKHLLNRSTSVPVFYLHQFWLTPKANLDDESFTVTLDRQVYTVDHDVLRTVFLLPQPDNEFAPILPELDLLDFFIELGYDVDDDLPLIKHSRFNAKNIPQPWRTFCLLVVRSISGRKSGHEHPGLEHLQAFWGMVTMTPIDFAVPIMNDIVYSIQTGREKTMIPFTRFTKLLIEYFCKDTPKFIKRMGDPNEPKHLFEDDFTTSFINTTTSSTKQKGMRLPEYLLDDNINKSLNYKFYDDAYNGIQEEATIQTRSKGSVKSGSTTSTTGSPQTKSKTTPKTKPSAKTKTSSKPKPTPKPKPATKPKKKVTPKFALQDEPTPPPSERDSEFNTESEEEEEDFERRVRVPEEAFPATKIAIQQSLETFEAESRKRKGITINEPNDDEEDEPIVEQLVDKRKLKSIIVDTRAEEKQFLK